MSTASTTSTKPRTFSLFDAPAALAASLTASATSTGSNSSATNSNNNGNGSVTNNISKSDSASNASGNTSPRRKSLAKADNLTVALSGGTTKSKMGQLKKKNSTIFGTSYKASYLKVDNGDIIFAVDEDALADADADLDEKNGGFRKHSLFEIREIRVLADPTEFQIKVGLPEGKNNLRTMVLKADTAEEVNEWIGIIKHEIKNQVLVCKSMAAVLSEKGKPERAEPLFLQSIDALNVAFGPDHIEVSDILHAYSKWLQSQNRMQESKLMKRKAKAIARNYYEENKVEGATVSDDSDTEDAQNASASSLTSSSSPNNASTNGNGNQPPPLPPRGTAGSQSEAATDSPRGRPKSWRFSFSRSSRALSSPR